MVTHSHRLTLTLSLSYELTKRDGKTGSPEKPLSDLGKVSYRSYWTHVLMTLFLNHEPKTDISMTDLSVHTGIKMEDIISTLQSLDMIKVWKGQHVVYVKQSLIRSYWRQKYVHLKSFYVLTESCCCILPCVLDSFRIQWLIIILFAIVIVFRKEFRLCKPECLTWQPPSLI